MRKTYICIQIGHHKTFFCSFICRLIFLVRNLILTSQEHDDDDDDRQLKIHFQSHEQTFFNKNQVFNHSLLDVN